MSTTIKEVDASYSVALTTRAYVQHRPRTALTLILCVAVGVAVAVGVLDDLLAVDDRAEVLAALGCVDYVVIFEGKRATNLLQAVRPHLYAKGGDYTPDSLDKDERQVLDAAGSEIRILPLVPGRSTTAVVQRMGGS